MGATGAKVALGVSSSAGTEAYDRPTRIRRACFGAEGAARAVVVSDHACPRARVDRNGADRTGEVATRPLTLKTSRELRLLRKEAPSSVQSCEARVAGSFMLQGACKSADHTALTEVHVREYEAGRGRPGERGQGNPPAP